MARLTPHSAYKAIRFLADKIYEFDKKNDFDIPKGEVLLSEYAEELRFIVDEVLRIARAPVMKPIDFKKRIRKPYKKKAKKQAKKAETKGAKKNGKK